MINPRSEKLLSLADITKLPWLPKTSKGRRVAVSTVWRWAIHGVRGGKRLETVRVGGTLFSSEAAMERFIEQTSSITELPPEPKLDREIEARLKKLRAI